MYRLLITFLLLGVILQLQAQDLRPFLDSQSGIFGYLSSEGDTVIAPAFCRASAFSEGYAVVQPCGDRYIRRRPPRHLIDETGAIVLELPKGTSFSADAAVREGLIPVRDEWERYGYLNPQGDTILPFEYLTAGLFGEGLALVEVYLPAHEDGRQQGASRYLAINREGEQVFALPPGLAIPQNGEHHFSEGMMTVVDSESGRMGFVDKQGALAIPCEYDRLGNFSEGKAFAAVLLNTFMDSPGGNKIGYLDREGNWVITLPKELADLQNGCYFHGVAFQNGKAQMCIAENDGDCANGGCLTVNSAGKVIEEDWR